VDVATRKARKRLRAAWLAGCDGVPGTAATTEVFIADITGCEIEPR